VGERGGEVPHARMYTRMHIDIRTQHTHLRDRDVARNGHLQHDFVAFGQLLLLRGARALGAHGSLE
jgi:hypothetical protein